MLKKEQIKFLVIHCSDTPDKDNITARDIHNMHLSFGWDGIGYHKVINRNANVENGRPLYWQGAHVKGLNKESLGICLIGRNKFTQNQFISLERILREWNKIYTKAKIVGHCDAAKTSKTCPNFNVNSWLKERQIT